MLVLVIYCKGDRKEGDRTVNRSTGIEIILVTLAEDQVNRALGCWSPFDGNGVSGAELITACRLVDWVLFVLRKDKRRQSGKSDEDSAEETHPDVLFGFCSKRVLGD